MAKREAPAKMEEVTQLQAESPKTSGLNLEAGLIFVTFLALLVGVVVAQLCLKDYFGRGLLS